MEYLKYSLVLEIEISEDVFEFCLVNEIGLEIVCFFFVFDFVDDYVLENVIID